MTAAVLPLRRGSGRQTAAAEAAWGECVDYDTHCREALAFVDSCRPYLDVLEKVFRELTPAEHQLVLGLQRRFDLYELRHLPQPDEPQPMAAAA